MIKRIFLVVLILSSFLSAQKLHTYHKFQETAYKQFLLKIADSTNDQKFIDFANKTAFKIKYDSNLAAEQIYENQLKPHNDFPISSGKRELCFPMNSYSLRMKCLENGLEKKGCISYIEEEFLKNINCYPSLQERFTFNSLLIKAYIKFPEHKKEILKYFNIELIATLKNKNYIPQSKYKSDFNKIINSFESYEKKYYFPIFPDIKYNHAQWDVRNDIQTKYVPIPNYKKVISNDFKNKSKLKKERELCAENNLNDKQCIVLIQDITEYAKGRFYGNYMKLSMVDKENFNYGEYAIDNYPKYKDEFDKQARTNKVELFKLAAISFLAILLIMFLLKKVIREDNLYKKIGIYTPLTILTAIFSIKFVINLKSFDYLFCILFC